MGNTYKILVKCGNCLQKIYIEIPKGVPFKGYKITCQNCEVPGGVLEDVDNPTITIEHPSS